MKGIRLDQFTPELHLLVRSTPSTGFYRGEALPPEHVVQEPAFGPEHLECVGLWTTSISFVYICI